MARKRYTAEQIINHLREAEILISQGKSIREVTRQIGISERRACRVLGQCRRAQRYEPKENNDETVMRERIITVAKQYGRYGYRRITALLQSEGWQINHKRVERIWRQESLKVPKKQPKRGRLWLNDGSCVRLRPEYPNHVWAYDFVFDRTHNGRALKMLTVVDEYSRECPGIEVARKLTSRDVLRVLAKLMLCYGVPDHIRSDNGPEFVAKAVRKWLSRLNVGTLFIESFNASFRKECLNAHWFQTLEEAKQTIEQWRKEYNEERPHSSLGNLTPMEYAENHDQPETSETKKLTLVSVQ